MTLTIHEAFDLPSREDITAQEFVVKLQTEDDEARDRKLVEDYVFTPTVEQELPLIFDALRHVHERGEEMGRFIHGSFGSGKSHFMALLGMLLRNRDVAWSKKAEVIEALRPHRDWIGDANLLVVRLHMLTADEEDFDRMVYEATNHALDLLGKAPFEFMNVDGVLDEMRREAEQYGDAFWTQLRDAGVLASQAAFEMLADGEPKDREDLARSFLTYKGRDTRSAGLDPNWGNGLQRLTAHVKAQGFGGLVFLVDEVMLWLGEKTEPEFKRAINQLNTMVDHATGRRAVPLFVFVARQRKLREFFPDWASDDAMEEHLAHHSKRFDQTTLQDVELRHICRQRVLKRLPANESEIAKVVDSLAEQHKKALPALLQSADIDYLKDVYPFHPALIEMLIDISSLMQRERTALRLLYELLVVHYPDLPLGQFLPVGSAFEAIFPPQETPQGRKKLDDLQSIHRLYYERFRPAMEQMLELAKTDESFEFDAERQRVLDQLVKTALLAEVSPRLKGSGGMTVERLVRLNDADVDGHTDRGRMTQAHQSLVELARKVPGSLQVSGSGRTAVVTVVLQGANLEEYMERARAKVSAHHVRLKVFSEILRGALGLTGAKWEGQSSGPVEIEWRGTKRKGSLVIRNVREMSNAQFKPDEGELFRLVVDYPWDDPGHTVEADRVRAQQVRQREGRVPTVCWLPRHMTNHEIEDLTDYAAAQHLCSKEGAELLTRLAEHERTQVLRQAESRMSMMRGRIVETLSRVYREHGQVYALWGDMAERAPEPELADNLRRLAQDLLDQRFPLHPMFGKSYSTSNLKSLCEWLIEAANTPDQSAPYDDGVAKVLKDLGQPLELLDLGQTKGRLRQDTRYIKAVMEKASGERVAWDGIDEMLMTEYGFETSVRNLFLLYVARLHSFRILSGDGTPQQLTHDGKARGGLVLERARLLTVAEWTRARDLGPALFAGLDAPSTNRTVSEQDSYVTALRERGVETRKHLQAVHTETVSIIGEAAAPESSRLALLREANTRLAPLAKTTDSHTALKELLAAWPDDASDDHRSVVREANGLRGAVESINKGGLDTLRQVPDTNSLVGEAREHIAALVALLRDDGERLSTDRIAKWNQATTALIQRIVAKGHATPPPPPPGSGPPAPPPPRTPPPPPPTESFHQASVDASSMDALSDFWLELRKKLQSKGGRVKLRVIVEDEG